jgi:diguanylate cyclase (GGDEF)-like protein
VMHAASSAARAQVAMPLAIVGSLAYAALLVATASGLIAHAPALGTPLPSHAQSLVAGVVVVLSVLTTTSLVLRQVMALDRAAARLHELSTLDELTGLANRRELIRSIFQQLARVRRGARCALVMLDLDGFKRVNDHHGHEAGDRLLERIAAALTGETRDVDVVARVGGDEFVVLLPDTDTADALPVADRVVTAIGRAARSAYPDIRVTASAGLTMLHVADEPADALKRADLEAYAAKRAGGGRVRLADPRPASGVVAAPVAQPERARRHDG